MSSETQAQIRSIQSLESCSFLVADYQRGYKWGLEEIEFLLDDIFQFDKQKEQFYCLQPIVLKYIDKNAKYYELIDGQQRLSTIYLILKCLDVEIYTLSYQTRATSQKFIEDISQLEYVKLDIDSDFDDILKILQEEWKKYLANNSTKNNIDNYHFFCAYHYITQWINDCDRNELETLQTNLLENTKVIWYNVDNYDTMNSSAEEIFVNFNDGKIALVQAELVKALFVLSFNNEHNLELKAFKLNQFADEWNRIEHELQDDQFWFFISNDISDNKKYNRIDILFDLIQEKSKDSENDLYSYHKYYESYQDNDDEKRLDWNEVIDMFNVVKEWYDNRNTYHLIGYVVNENLITLNNLVKEYRKTHSKTAFEDKLRTIIRKAYFENQKDEISKKYDYDNIVYGDHTKEIHSILVLFNIATYHYTDTRYRFPFELLKKEKGWSLEHIHAINTDNFKTKKDLLDWLEDVGHILSAYGKSLKKEELDPIKKLVNTIEDQLKIVEKPTSETNNLIKKLAELIEGFYNKDALSNICLLDLKTNIILSKKYFKAKREDIVFFDKSTIQEIKAKHKTIESKPYIPIATKNIFQKYYTANKENLQMTYWGLEDRKYYLENMKSIISKYLNITN